MINSVNQASRQWTSLRRIRLAGSVLAILTSMLLAGCQSDLTYLAGGSVDAKVHNNRVERLGYDKSCLEKACDTFIQLLEASAPVYPRELHKAGESGFAEIAFTVKTDGTTGDFEMVETSHPEFAEASIAALDKWRFKPATKGGQPIALEVSQNFKFKPRGVLPVNR